VTPGLKLDSSEHFVSCYHDRLEPKVVGRVYRAKQARGNTVEQMLLARPGARLGSYAVPFGRQFSQLLRRKVAMTLRNPLAIGMPIFLPIALGSVVGAMFMNIGDRGLMDQVAFVFIMVTVLGLGGMQLMPILIEERHFMKYETSESLYSESAAVLASFCIDVPLALVGAACEVFVMFLLSGMAMEHMQTVFVWCMVVFFVYDSLFGLVAAVAADGQQAQAIATPVLAIFMLCNGFIISEHGAPIFMRWIFPISPNLYSMQAIVVELAEHAGIEGQAILARTGYVNTQHVQGMAVMGGMIVLLRCLQLLALTFMHKVQR